MNVPAFLCLLICMQSFPGCERMNRTCMEGLRDCMGGGE